VAPREQLLIHNNIVVANVLSGGGSVGSQSWNLLDTLTTYGTVTAATGYTETLVIGGHNETLAAWNMLGSSSSPLLNITLNGVQVQIGNTETYDQLALVQNSEINISEIAANPGSPKVITFNGGFSPSSNQLLITGWQGQIGARATGGTGGENAELLFALGQGTVPAVAMNQLVTSVVFDLGDTDNLNAAVANAYGATSTSSTPLAIPNFAGQPGIVNSGYDYGEWITGPTGYAELVPYFGPVPEPTTILAGLALVAAVAWRERRRLTSLYVRVAGANGPPAA
jgi:hypothetical protein